MTSEQDEVFARNPRFVGLTFPDISKPETLEKHYVGKLCKKGVSLMNGLLAMDPHKRFSALEALAHPYFDTVRDTEVEQMIKQRRGRTRSGVRRKQS